MCGELLTLLRSHLHHRIVIRVVAVEGEREGERALLEVDLPFGLHVMAFGYVEFSRTIFVKTRAGEDAVQLHSFGRLDRFLEGRLSGDLRHHTRPDRGLVGEGYDDGAV